MSAHDDGPDTGKTVIVERPGVTDKPTVILDRDDPLAAGTPSPGGVDAPHGTPFADMPAGQDPFSPSPGAPTPELGGSGAPPLGPLPGGPSAIAPTQEWDPMGLISGGDASPTPGPAPSDIFPRSSGGATPLPAGGDDTEVWTGTLPAGVAGTPGNHDWNAGNSDMSNPNDPFGTAPGPMPTELISPVGSPVDPMGAALPGQPQGMPSGGPQSPVPSAPPAGSWAGGTGDTWVPGTPGGAGAGIAPPPPPPGMDHMPQGAGAEPAAGGAGTGQQPAQQISGNPVVGWVVVISGPGKGNCRNVYYGNNDVGRAPNQRIPLDFGDNTISAEAQVYIRYDHEDRKFYFVPNMSKANIVTLNDTKPMIPVQLKPFDEIGIGKTRVRFVPFCGPDFDWSDLEG